MMEMSLISFFPPFLVELSKVLLYIKMETEFLRLKKKSQIEITFPFCPSNQSTDQLVSQVWLNTILCPPCNSLGKFINKNKNYRRSIYKPPQSGSEWRSFVLMCASTRAHMHASFDPYTFVCRPVMSPRQRYESVLVFGLPRLFPPSS